MNFKDFLIFCESNPLEYKVVQRPRLNPNLGYIPLGDKIAIEAEKEFKAGRMDLMQFLEKQRVGFRAIINGTEYLRSMDGLFVKKIYPISGFKGSAIGQRELYSPRTVTKYTAYLKRYPNKDTEAITVKGTPDNYSVRDGHHRMQSYKNAGRTEIPVWIEAK